MFKRKIAVQLTASFVIIVLITMLTVGAVFVQMFKQYAFDNREQMMLDWAHSIAEILTDTGSGGNPVRGMGGFVKFLNTITDSDVWILDDKGKPWILGNIGMGTTNEAIHSLSSGPLPSDASDLIGKVLSGKEVVSESFSSLYKEATLTVATPIYDSDQKVVGLVMLHAPVTGISKSMNQAIGILAISLGVALLVAIGLGIAYSVRFIRPLKQMNGVALAMAGGDYRTRTKISRLDELGQLGQSLNFLASELSQTIDLLYQEKGKLQDIITSISEGIVSFDGALKPLNMNASLGEIMNPGNDYFLEHAMADFAELGLLNELREVMEGKMTIRILRTYKSKHLKFSLSPIMDSKGAVIGVVALVQDVSESEKLEQLRRDFVANVSHEFRTPLTVIKGSLEAISDGTITDEEDVKRYMGRLLTETRGLERLVSDLLDLSKLQSDEMELHLELVCLPELLEDTVRGIRGLASKRDILIQMEFCTDIPPILGDYDRLRQLIIIFLDNAIKYSPVGSVIHLGVKIQDQVEITIRDQGCGISASDLPYIWDRFYQSDTSRKGSGTGLGLSIAKRLIEAHGGTVTVKSAVGSGTEFAIGFLMQKP